MDKSAKNVMPRKIQVTLPDRIGDELEKWAEYEGRPLANLCNYLLEAALKAEKEKNPDWARQDSRKEGDRP